MFRKLFWSIIEKIAIGRIKAYFAEKKRGPQPDKPEEKEVIAPKTPFNTSRLEWREIQKQKQPKKKGSR
jgi:hypothetical protein